jgi:hypothetical protein
MLLRLTNLSFKTPQGLAPSTDIERIARDFKEVAKPLLGTYLRSARLTHIKNISKQKQGLVTFRDVGVDDVRAFLKSSIGDTITDEDIHEVPQCEEMEIKVNEIYILNLYKNELFITDLLDIKSAAIHSINLNNLNPQNLDIFNDSEETNENLKNLEKKNLEKNLKNNQNKKLKKNGKSSILGMYMNE